MIGLSITYLAAIFTNPLLRYHFLAILKFRNPYR
jgi:hypothetical protein